MKEESYLIGEVSRITGVSKDTLHFYHKIGLLIPDYQDEKNQYRYYSRYNLWQLDIISICRKLNIPLEQVRRILSFHDNQKILELLMEYRKEALRLSEYYRQVSDDILWYSQEEGRIREAKIPGEIRLCSLEEEIVIGGFSQRGQLSYHANLQEAAREALKNTGTIRRRYGYVIDVDQARAGRFTKCREYLRLPPGCEKQVEPQALMSLPAGQYGVFVLRIQRESADFKPLFDWAEEHGFDVQAIYGEEVGLQLFDYLDDYLCEVKALLSKK